MVKRFEIYLLDLDADMSGGAKQTRPCVVVSPDEMNRNIASVIVAPIDSAKNAYPTRPTIEFLNKKRSVVLDQIRTVDKARLAKKTGELDKEEQAQVLSILQEMFAA
jgi:mRNA interferase MazF